VAAPQVEYVRGRSGFPATPRYHACTREPCCPARSVGRLSDITIAPIEPDLRRSWLLCSPNLKGPVAAVGTIAFIPPGAWQCAIAVATKESSTSDPIGGTAHDRIRPRACAGREISRCARWHGCDHAPAVAYVAGRGAVRQPQEDENLGVRGPNRGLRSLARESTSEQRNPVWTECASGSARQRVG
jgi:hypothetical protein